MERDFFKQFVQEHKDAFESEALPPNMLGNILEKLKEREKQAEHEASKVKKLRINYTWLAIACTLLIVGGSYLFVSQETAEFKKQDKLIALAPTTTAKTPENSENTEIQVISTTKTSQVFEKQFAKNQATTIDANQAIFKGLGDSTSVAARLDAILKAGSLTALKQPLKAQLCKTFNEDNNDNVRLAALEVLAKIADDKYVHEQLMAGLSKQKDPVVQLELIKIMGNNSSPEATDKLIAMANNPLTLDAVKEQVYYALLTNQ